MKEELLPWMYYKSAMGYDAFYRASKKAVEDKHYSKVVILRDKWGRWFIEMPIINPLNTGEDYTDENAALLFFKTDLWLYEDGHKLDDLFVLPKEILEMETVHT